eukprot:PhM_4_TR10230/c0_g1_i1/m.89018
MLGVTTSVSSMSSPARADRIEAIPKSLSMFNIPAVALARHCLKYGSNKRTTKKVFVLREASFYVCGTDGSVSRYVPLSSVSRIRHRGNKELLISVHGEPDVLLEFGADSKNTSNDFGALLSAVRSFVETAQGIAEGSLPVEELDSATEGKLVKSAFLMKSKARSHPVACLESETRRVLSASRMDASMLAGDATFRDVSPNRAQRQHSPASPTYRQLIMDPGTTEDGLPKPSPDSVECAVQREKALEAEVSLLRQKLEDSERLRALQSQVDQLQQILVAREVATNYCNNSNNATARRGIVGRGLAPQPARRTTYQDDEEGAAMAALGEANGDVEEEEDAPAVVVERTDASTLTLHSTPLRHSRHSNNPTKDDDPKETLDVNADDDDSYLRRNTSHLLRPAVLDYTPGGSDGGFRRPHPIHFNTYSAMTFRANKPMWANLVRVVRAATEQQHPRSISALVGGVSVMSPPVVRIAASHSTEPLLVGEDFLRDFIAGWRALNCIRITLKARKEEEEEEEEQSFFYAPLEFWELVCGEHVASVEDEDRGEYVDDCPAADVKVDVSRRREDDALALDDDGRPPKLSEFITNYYVWNKAVTLWNSRHPQSKN